MRPFIRLFFLLFLLSGFGYTALAQDSVYNNKKGGYYKVKKSAEDLKVSLAADDEAKTAQQYETLSEALAEKGDYPRAEGYLQKALEIYTRLNKKKEAAQTQRSLAKLQESQQKIGQAIENYQSASEVSKDKTLEQANANDANRLRYNRDPKTQMNYAQSNVDLFEKEGRKEEAVQAYRQLAETQIQQKNTKGAVASYAKAIEASSKPEDVATLTNEIAKAYSENNETGKAINISTAALEKARQQRDIDLQISQMQELAGLYIRDNQPGKAGPLLEAAYTLALKSGNTLKAKTALTALVKHYRDQKDTQHSLVAYEQFINNLDSLIRSDSSLVDARMFELTEGRIKELEKERDLQLELISRKNRFNYVLIGSVALMLILFFFIVRALYAIKTKNKKIALQSLRREMNPHFIFNSLNSVNQYIAENNELEANKYLTSYSGLMRNIMEHSNKDFVSLSTELEQLKKYLGLEHMRFHDQFEYQIQVDEHLDTDAVMVPNMLLQPHLENAIWHGLRYKEEKGMLQLDFKKQGKNIEVSITDNGIGLSKSKALKTVNQKAHQSRGITNTTERVSLLNDLYKTRITMHMEELSGEGKSGTRVLIRLPLIHKH